MTDAIWSAYIVLALLSASKTWQEQKSSATGSLAWRAAGLLLCIVWPLTLALLASAYAMRRMRLI